MVEAEEGRDYYADLELPPTANINEIKKAFKRLALEYHPDRNPGKEVEFNSKFQAIQSANEVLSDPQQRANYDAQCIHSGLLHSYPNAASRPPKPNVPPRAQRTQFSPPTPRHTSPRFSTRPETDDFKAWKHFKHRQGPIPGTTERRMYRNNSARQPAPWGNLQNAGISSFLRSKTFYIPPTKARVSHNTSMRYKPSPRSKDFSQGECPTTSKAHTNIGLPQTPTANMRDPIYANPSTRVSTPYCMNVGEKTAFNRAELFQSSTKTIPSDKNSRTGLYDSEPLHPKSQHVRATSIGSVHGEATVLRHVHFSGESSSSSDEAETKIPHPWRRPKRRCKPSRRSPASTGQHPSFSIDDAGWNGIAHPNYTLFNSFHKSETINMKFSNSTTLPIDSHNTTSGVTLSSSLSSCGSGGASPMIIDPVLTHTSTNVSKPQTNGNAAPLTPPGDTSPSPSPLSSNGHSETDANPTNLKSVIFNKEGLDDIDDFKKGLSFESRASATEPIFTEPSQRDLPFPPVPPSRPADSRLHSYFEEMTLYMRKWRDFNSKMLTHFQKRQSMQDANCDWMSAIGKEGYDGYMQGLEEDKKARAHWEIACEEHNDYVRIWSW